MPADRAFAIFAGSEIDSACGARLRKRRLAPILEYALGLISRLFLSFTEVLPMELGSSCSLVVNPKMDHLLPAGSEGCSEFLQGICTKNGCV